MYKFIGTWSSLPFSLYLYSNCFCVIATFCRADLCGSIEQRPVRLCCDHVISGILQCLCLCVNPYPTVFMLLMMTQTDCMWFNCVPNTKF